MENSFKRWDDCYENGGSDPFWYDGYNLNLIRRHILAYKMKIEEEYDADDYPEIYHRVTPPEVSDGYMANADAIRAGARKAHALYLEDENYLFLWESKDRIPLKTAEKLGLKSILRCTSRLEYAIISDDLLAMRRHMNAEGYLSTFAFYAEKVREILGLTEERQGMSMRM
jgi:hypothetical protein